MTPQERLDKYIREDRLIRGEWAGEKNGKATACLLAALSHKAGEDASPASCPSTLMPAWFAYLTPWIDDSGTIEHWPDVVKRYASLAHRWHVLTKEDWQRLEYVVRAIFVREAMTHVPKTGFDDVKKACAQSIKLCERAANGEAVKEEEWWAARAAAWADKMIDQVLDALEAACAKREAKKPEGAT